jgi:hypothetical protein
MTPARSKTLVTVNGYTREETFDEGVLVMSELGEPDRAPVEVLANRGDVTVGHHVTLDVLQDCIRAAAAVGIV